MTDINTVGGADATNALAVEVLDDLLRDREFHRMPAHLKAQHMLHALASSGIFLAQWRDFSTAPGDSTEIVVYRPDAGLFMAHFVVPEMFHGEDNVPEEYEPGDAYWFSTDGEDLTGDLPTHWCLPAFPQEPVSA